MKLLKTIIKKSEDRSQKAEVKLFSLHHLQTILFFCFGLRTSVLHLSKTTPIQISEQVYPCQVF